MSLADSHSRVTRRPVGGTCSIAAIRAVLSPEDLDYLDRHLAMHPRDMPATEIAQFLTDDGHPIKGQTVARHRRGECTC